MVHLATDPREGDVSTLHGWSVGLDIGGTKTLGVLVRPDGTVGGTPLRLPTGRGVDAVVATAVQAVRGLVGTVPGGAAGLTGVGIGLPGVVDPATGQVEHAVNLGIEDGVPLAALVSAALDGVPVQIENDLNAAALGAAHVLPGPVTDLAFLALGTGLAAGLVLDGRLRRGARGSAGEIGHLVHVAGGIPCPCGQRGCLEQYASGTAVGAAWPVAEGDVPPPVALFAAADAGDPAAVAVRDTFADAVAAAVRVLVLTTDVAHVVIGGGVSELGQPLLREVRRALDRSAEGSAFVAAMLMGERVSLAPHGVPVGAVGAALAGRKEH